MIYKEIIDDSCLSQNGSSIKKYTVKGIVFQDNKILMLYSQINKDYSFPGGGIEPGESKHDALKRELLEECGAEIKTIGPPMIEIVEIYPAFEADIDLFIRDTHFFPCQISEQFVKPDFSPSEISCELSVVWVALEKALQNNQALLQKSDPLPPRRVNRETFILEQLAQHPELYRGNHLD